MWNAIIDYLRSIDRLCGHFGLSLYLAVAVVIPIILAILYIRYSIKFNRLNPKHYPLDYLRKHKDEFEDYFKEFPELLGD